MRCERRVREPIVAIAHNPRIEDAVTAALDALPAERLLKPTDTVMIKFNAVSVQSEAFKKSPVTKPETLRAVIDWFKGKALKRLILAEGSKGGHTGDILRETGLMPVIEDSGVEFLDLNTGPYIDIPLNYDKPATITVNRVFAEIDVLVSLAVLKMHEEATVTLTQKNIALGIPSAEIHGYPIAVTTGVPAAGRTDPHADLHGFIVRVMQKVPIDIAIIDGKTTMIGTGPTHGQTKETNIILAGTDALAVDSVGARFLGFKPQAVRYLYQGIMENLGEGDLHGMDLRGTPYREAAKLVTRQIYGKEIVVE